MAVRPDAQSSFNGNVSAAAFSWTHTAAAGAYVIVDVISDRAQMPSSGITYGGVAMTRTAVSPVMTVNAGSGYLCQYELAGVAGGAQTIQFPAVAGAVWTVATAVSYTGVTSANTPTVSAISNSGVGGEPSIGPVSVAAGSMVVNTIGGSTTGGGAISASAVHGGNNRLLVNAGFAVGLIVSDAYTADTFSSAYVSAGTLACGITTTLNGSAYTGDIVTRDASPAGGHNVATVGSTGTTLTWSHVFGANPNAVVVFLDGYHAGHSASEYTRTVSINGVPLVLLAVQDLGFTGSADTWVEMWGLIGSSVTAWANTTQTVTVNEFFTSNGALNYPALHGTSASYNNVGSFGTPVINTTQVSTPTVTVPTGQYHMVAACFGAQAFTDQSGNGHQLYNFSYSVFGQQGMYAEDIPGTGTSVIPTCGGANGNVAGIGVDLAPAIRPVGASTTATPGVPTVTAPDTVSPAGALTTATPGAPTVTAPDVVSPTGASTTGAPGTPDVTAPDVISPSGTSTTATPGTPTVINPLAPSGATTTATPGTPAVTAPDFIAPTGVITTATPGAPAVTAPDVVAPTGASTAATPGSPAVTAPNVVSPAGTSTSATPGTPVVTAPDVVAPTGAATTATPGTPAVSGASNVIHPSGAMTTATPGVLAVAILPAATGVTISKSASPGVILTPEDNGCIVLSPRRIS